MAWDHVFDISLWQRPASTRMYKMDLMREPDKVFCFRLEGCLHRCWVLYSSVFSPPLSNCKEKRHLPYQNTKVCLKYFLSFFFFFNPRNTHLQISRRELQGHLVQTYAEIPRYRDMLSDLKTHEDRQVPYLLHCIPSRYSVIKCWMKIVQSLLHASRDRDFSLFSFFLMGKIFWNW